MHDSSTPPTITHPCASGRTIAFVPGAWMQVVMLKEAEIWRYNAETTDEVVVDYFDAAPNCLAAAPDGSLVVTGFSDGTRDIYMNALSGRATNRRLAWQRTSVQIEQESMSGNRKGSRTTAATHAAFSPDGQSLLAGFSDGRVLHVPLSTPWTGTELLTHNKAVTAVAMTTKDSLLVSASRDATVRILNRDMTERSCLLHHAPVTTMRVSPDEAWLATTAGARLYIWDIRDGTLRHELRGHSKAIKALAISPDGTWLATAGSDRTVRVWDTAEWNSTVRVTTTRPLVDIAISADGKDLATRDASDEVEFWDAATGGYHGFTWEHYLGPGITRIVVEFSGCGDEGDVTEVRFENDKGEVLGTDNPDLYGSYLPDDFELGNGSFGTVEIDCESGTVFDDDVTWREGEEEDEEEEDWDDDDDDDDDDDEYEDDDEDTDDSTDDED